MSSAPAASASTTAHCPQCERDVRVSEPYAFRGADKLRATLTCGHVLPRAIAGLDDVTLHHIDSDGANAAYAIPAHELLSEPQCEWDPERRHYRREHCSYCLKGSYSFAEEQHTGRFFCRTCIKNNGFKVRGR
jgi:hypothetical protein